MKYQSTNTKLIHDIDWGTVKKDFTCPDCSKNRKKKTDKCLTYFPDTNSAYCHHCNSSFLKYNPHQEQKEYVIPEWKNKTDLTDNVVKYFEGRMISQKTLNKMGVYSSVEWMPQINKETGVICFPYFRGDKVVNIKYRGKDPQGKRLFKLHTGSELILYNLNCVVDYDEVIIVEGEVDALSFVECGFNNVLSVPNGAGNSTDYLNDAISLFDHIKTIFLATDQDTKGIELRDELARRFGPERCRIVSFKQHKDANDYLVNEGGVDFKALIDEAKPYPVKGIVPIQNIYQDILSLYETGVVRGKEIGMKCIDDFITWETSRLAIVTGIPGSGKSEFVDFLVAKLNMIYGWKAAYFTPENYPLKFHYSKLFEKFIGKKFSKNHSTENEFDMAFDYIKNNFFYIMPEDDFTSESIIESAKGLVKSKGIKMLVIDPYNKIDHKYTDSETQYISRFLDRIITFAKVYDILVILVAHPRKMQKNSIGAYEVPSLYDINGSANFYNKCDYGFTVHREVNDQNVMQNVVKVFWQKIKFKHLGEQGITPLRYNFNNGRFEQEFGDYWDNYNWLNGPDQTPQIIDFTEPLHNQDIQPDIQFGKTEQSPF
jgi:twinkle protein